MPRMCLPDARWPLIVVGLAFVALVGCRTLTPAPPPPPSMQVELDRAESVRLAQLQYEHFLDERMPAIAAPQIVDRAVAQQEVMDLVQSVGAPPRNTEREGLARALADRTGPDTPHVARLFFIEQLGLIGRDECVPALITALDSQNVKIRDVARRALQRNESPQAAAAIRQSLRESTADDVKWQATLLHTIGQRRDHEAVALLTKYSRDPRDQVAVAAIEALGDLDGPEIGQRLSDLLHVESTGRRHAAARSLLRFAQRLEQAQLRLAAGPLYERLWASPTTEAVRLGALAGLARTQRNAALPKLTTAWQTTDAEKVRRVALRLIAEIPGPEALQRLTAILEQSDEAAAPYVLLVVSERPPREVRELIAVRLGDDRPAIQAAAARGLARVGDARDVLPLVTLASSSPPPARTAAIDALTRLHDPGVEPQLIALLSESHAPRQTRTVIDVVVARQMDTALPQLFELTGQTHAAPVRALAYRALSELASWSQINNVLRALLEETDPRVLEAAANAIVTLANRQDVAAQRVKPIVAAYDRAESSQRAALLGVLGRLGTRLALERIRGALTADDAAVRLAAIEALGQWNTPAALDDLLRVAQTAEERKTEVLALRSFAMVFQRVDLPAEQAMRYFERAWDAADRPAEKRRLLGVLGDVRHPAALKLAQQQLAEPQVRNEAALAIAALTDELAAEARQACLQALEAAQQYELSIVTQEQLGEAESLLRSRAGYIGQWQYAGPYTKQGVSAGELIDASFPPEQENAPVSWQPLEARRPNDPWIFDFTQLDRGGDRVIYTRTFIHSPAAQDARLEIGSDDGVAVWLNGVRVHRNPAFRGLSPGQDKIDVRLSAGPNELLVKVVQAGGGWGLVAAVRAPDGGPLPNVKISSEPEERGNGGTGAD